MIHLVFLGLFPRSVKLDEFMFICLAQEKAK